MTAPRQAPSTSSEDAAPTPPLIELRPVPDRRFHDCSDAAVADGLLREIRALPFLGEFAADTDRLTAGDYAEVVLTYTVGASGIADSGWLKLCFKYYSDWDLQTDDPAGPDYASAELISKSSLGGAFPDSLATVDTLRCHYDVKGGERPFQKALLVHLQDGYMRPGDRLAIRLGDRRHGGPGTRVQTFAEDQFTFRLLVDPLGTSRMAHAADVALDIVAGPPQRLVLAGPRLTRAGETAPLRMHLEDEWGNACSGIPARLEYAMADASPVACSLPDEGWAAATIDLPEMPIGRHEITATAGLPAGPVLRAATVVDVVRALPAPRAFFADLHVHSNDTVGTNDSASNLAYGRTVGGLDVLGYTANDFQITDKAWADVVGLCRKLTEDGRFICFPGVEWCGNAAVGGDHNVIYLGDDTTLARSLEWHDGLASRRPEPEHWPISELYRAFEANPEQYLLMPHVGGRRAILDWHHPGLERLIEVHSAWGTSSWFLEDALSRGMKLGVSANSDEHRGRPGGGAPGANIFGGCGGLTGILAPQLTKEHIGAALRSRHTWATTGARAVALLRSGDQWMGDELVTDDDELTVSWTLYGDAPWEHMGIYDAHGPVHVGDLNAEAGYAPDLVRIRWGGARHRDRYRWATWTGQVSIGGTSLISADPWAARQPMHVTTQRQNIEWQNATYGADAGLMLRLARAADADIEVTARVAEDNRSCRVRLKGSDLAAGPARHDLGGAGLHLTVERLTETRNLPWTISGDLTIRPPEGNSLIYLRARQNDGHQAWSSPLFITRSK